MPRKSDEADFQAAVVQMAALFGWLVQHSRPAKVGDKWMTAITGDVGFPDLVLAHPSKGLVFAELKSATGKLAPAQERWRDALQGAGAEWYLWRPDDLKPIMRRLSKAGR